MGFLSRFPGVCALYVCTSPGLIRTQLTTYKEAKEELSGNTEIDITKLIDACTSTQNNDCVWSHPWHQLSCVFLTPCKLETR